MRGCVHKYSAQDRTETPILLLFRRIKRDWLLNNPNLKCGDISLKSGDLLENWRVPSKKLRDSQERALLCIFCCQAFLEAQEGEGDALFEHDCCRNCVPGHHAWRCLRIARLMGFDEVRRDQELGTSTSR